MSYTHISTTTTAKAAKRHVCIWCGESILLRSRYMRVAGVFEGDFQSDAYHIECRAAAEAHFDEAGEDGFSPHENERPPSAAAIEYESWDSALLLQRGRLHGRPRKAIDVDDIGMPMFADDVAPAGGL